MIKFDSLDRRPTSDEISVLFELLMRRPLVDTELASFMLKNELTIYRLIGDLVNEARRANYISDGSLSSPLDQAITPNNLETLFNLLLFRPVGNEEYTNDLVASGQTVHNVLQAIIRSPEFSASQAVDRTDKIDGATFRIPNHLVRAPLIPQRVLIIGSCAMDPFCREVLSRHPSTHFARIVFNNAMRLPPLSSEDAKGFDFQILQLPIRSILPDQLYMKATASVEAMVEAFEISRKMLDLNFSAATQYNREHGLETLCTTF